jgi:hypothetical protein
MTSQRPLVAHASSARHARDGQGGMQTLTGQAMKPGESSWDDGPHTVPFTQVSLVLQAG